MHQGNTIPRESRDPAWGSLGRLAAMLDHLGTCRPLHLKVTQCVGPQIALVDPDSSFKFHQLGIRKAMAAEHQRTNSRAADENRWKAKRRSSSINCAACPAFALRDNVLHLAPRIWQRVSTWDFTVDAPYRPEEPPAPLNQALLQAIEHSNLTNNTPRFSQFLSFPCHRCPCSSKSSWHLSSSRNSTPGFRKQRCQTKTAACSSAVDPRSASVGLGVRVGFMRLFSLPAP